MTALVTGGAGFVAAYLAEELESAGWDVVLTDALGADGRDIDIVELTDAERLRELVARIKPDAVVHLGAISFVPDAEKDATLLERVNVGGTGNLISAVEAQAPKARFLFVSTSQVSLQRLSAYAKSKLAAEERVIAAVARGLDAFIARPANHTGAGQSARFVVSSFIKQAKEIKSAVRDRFIVGNLESVRDFTDVRDVVHGYRLLLEKGERGGIYLIGSNVRLTMRELLVKIADAAGVSPDYEVDESLWRPTDESPILDTSMMRELGWRASISLDDTIVDMIGKVSK